MTKQRTDHEELLSAHLDGELSPAQRKELDRALDESPELEQLTSSLASTRPLFQEYARVTAQDVPMERFWGELQPRLPQHQGAQSQSGGVTSAELLQILSHLNKGPSIFERLFAGLVPALVGAAAALAVVFFVASPARRRGDAPQKNLQANAGAKKAPPKAPVLVKRPAPPPGTVKVATKPEIKPGTVLPNPAVENIVSDVESCTIESMNAADDTITTVFKVADTDGSMITVIWLPMEEEGTSI